MKSSKTDLSMFEAALAAWLAVHLHAATGERKRRLAKGLGHAERLFLLRVWWPAFGNFDYLYPEYEVRDFNGGSRFIDFAYIRGSLRIAIEVDAFGTHLRNIDRRQFADHLMRQNVLAIDGWKVLRFSYDDFEDASRRCEQAIQQALGKWTNVNAGAKISLRPPQAAILAWAKNTDEPLSPIQVAAAFQIGAKTAARHLRALTAEGYLMPVNVNAERIKKYRIAQP